MMRQSIKIRKRGENRFPGRWTRRTLCASGYNPRRIRQSSAEGTRLKGQVNNRAANPGPSRGLKGQANKQTFDPGQRDRWFRQSLYAWNPWAYAWVLSASPRENIFPASRRTGWRWLSDRQARPTMKARQRPTAPRKLLSTNPTIAKRR